MTQDFRRLLEVLYPEGIEGWIEIRAFEGGVVHRRFAASIDAASIAALGLHTECEIYFGVNPRTTQGSADADVTKIVTVVADVDYKRFKDADEAAKILSYTGLAPSAIVESGGGLHVYWALETPVDNTEEFWGIRKQFIGLCNSDWVQDAARILRVPGTTNHKYKPATEVRVIDSELSRRYTPEMFRKIAKTPENIRQLLYTGSEAGFKTRSERDWKVVWGLVRAQFDDDEIRAIIAGSPSGDRYRERWPSLLDHDLEVIREETNDTVDDSFNVFERDNCFFAKTAQGGERKVATFTFEPEALLQSADDTDEDYISGTIQAEGTTHVWKGVLLPKKAFIDRKALAKHLNVAAWSWLGTDQDVVRFLPYLMKQIQNKNIPILQAVKTLGRYSTVWVTEANVITSKGVQQFTEAGYIFQNAHRERPQTQYNFINPAEYSTLVKQVYRLLPSINEPEVMWPIIGWYFASVFKPVLGAHGREFPILMLVGTRGAGKTATVKSAMLPLMGYINPRTYNCDTTEFVMLSLLSSSTSIPIAFSEYRADLPQNDKFIRRLRLLYDTGVDIRGRADQSTTAYMLTTPVCLDGEDEIEDAAFRERSVVVRFHPESVTPERKDAFYDLTELPLSDFAAPYAQFSLGYEPEYEKAYHTVNRVVGDEVSDRILANFSKVVAGLFAFVKYGTLYGARVPELTDEFLVKSVFARVASTTFLGETSRTRVVADSFVEDVINEVLRTGIGIPIGDDIISYSPFVWRYSPKENILYIHFVTTYNWWQQHQRRINSSAGSGASVKAQLRERNGEGLGQYSLGLKSIAIGHGRSIQAYQIDVHRAVEAGLDVPSSLRLVKTQSGSKVPVVGRQADG